MGSESVSGLTATSMLLSIEGLIGAGKTTLLRALEKVLSGLGWTVVIIDEPVEEWMKPMDAMDPSGRSLLDAFYEEPVLFSFPFQVSALLSRFQYITDAVTGVCGSAKRVLFITERCLQSDKACFADMLFNEGKMSALEFGLYNRIYDILRLRSPSVSGMVHLATTARTCHDQMTARGREA